MYAQFFGLTQEPFSIAPDPRYLFMSRRHREALAHLLYGLNGGGGFVLLSGEIGAGKTTVCRCFLEQIPKRTNVAYIFNPKLTVTELLKSVCDEFGIGNAPQGPGSATIKEYLDPLNEYLLRTHAVGQNNVLIIDEAQMLSAEVLEQLRLLTNLETNERKLLQIVLIGQPELRTLLARPELEQLAQRVIARFHLKALSAEETAQYIRHRLGVAGLTRGLPFDSKAIERIHGLSRGIPRRINLLCDRAMLGAYARGTQRIGREIVDKAAVEVFGRSERAAAAPGRPAPRRLPWVGAAAVGVAAVAGALGYFVALERSRPSMPVAAVPHGAASGAASAAASSGSQSVSAATGRTGAATVGGLPAPRVAPPTAASTPVPQDVASPSVPSRPAPAPIVLAATDLESVFGKVLRDDNEAWRELAALWRVDVAGEAPCAAALRQSLRCYRTGGATLEHARKLGRPAVLTLRDASGRPVYALLTGLSEQAAVLQMAGVAKTVTPASLARLWRGELATLWRAPPGYAAPLVPGDSGAAVDELAARFAALEGAPPPPAGSRTMDADLRGRVARFQAARGIPADGIPGPTTFMQLNRVSGGDEPTLAAPPY